MDCLITSDLTGLDCSCVESHGKSNNSLATSDLYEEEDAFSSSAREHTLNTSDLLEDDGVRLFQDCTSTPIGMVSSTTDLDISVTEWFGRNMDGSTIRTEVELGCWPLPDSSDEEASVGM